MRYGYTATNRVCSLFAAVVVSQAKFPLASCSCLLLSLGFPRDSLRTEICSSFGFNPCDYTGALSMW